MSYFKLKLICLMLLTLSSCSHESESRDSVYEEITLEFQNLDWKNTTRSVSTQKANLRDEIDPNAVNVRLAMAEFITTSESGTMGNTIFFSDRGNKQLSTDFVPFLSLDGTSDISFYVDDNRATQDVDVTVSNLAIDRAMQTWDNLTCSEFGLFEIPYEEQNQVGWVARFIQDEGLTDLDLGGSYDYYADIVHAGWLPAEIFDLLGEDGSTSILGVTFTLEFRDQAGVPLDIDNNGKTDTAFKEIYYNEGFVWNDGENIDIETVALHEAGHGFSQAHFGKAFLSGGNGQLHFSPRAVMNAGYSGIQTDISRTDEAGHCSNWAAWPKG